MCSRAWGPAPCILLTRRAVYRVLQSARAGKGPSITVDGSEVTVVHALTQDGARGLAQQIERKKDAVRHKDKRNLYLAEVIHATVLAWCERRKPWGRRGA